MWHWIEQALEWVCREFPVGWQGVEALAAVATAVAAFKALRVYSNSQKQHKRFDENTKQHIVVVSVQEDSLRLQYQMLKDNGLYNVVERTQETFSLESFAGEHIEPGVVVVEYSADAQFSAVFDVLVKARIPTLVYASEATSYIEGYPGIPPKKARLDSGIGDEVRVYEEVSESPYATIGTTPLRLCTDVFAIMSAYPQRRGLSSSK